MLEEGPDVEVDHPVPFPAPLPARFHRVEGGPPGPVAVGVGMEHRLHLRLQIRPHDRLGDPVRHGGHAEDADALAPCLRYLHRPDRRWEVRPRGHAIPELVEVPLEVPLELCDRLPVDTSGPLVGPDLLVGLPDNQFGNDKWLCRFRLRLAHRLLPQLHG